MDEYRKDIEEIKELLKKIQKDIAQLEIKIEAEPTAVPYYYHFTMPEPVPSTQATSATTMHEPTRSLNNPPETCFANYDSIRNDLGVQSVSKCNFDEWSK